MVTIIFEPHSITFDNEAGLASGRNDIDLSPEGVKRLHEQWPERYKDRAIDAIFCSDLQRSYKCGALIAKDKNIPIFIDSRLRECDYGDLTQKPKKLVDEQKVQRINEPFPNGESYQQCMDRMESFINFVKDSYKDKTIVVIGHRATQYGLEHHINDKDIRTCITEPWEYQPGWFYQI